MATYYIIGALVAVLGIGLWWWFGLFENPNYTWCDQGIFKVSKNYDEEVTFDDLKKNATRAFIYKGDFCVCMSLSDPIVAIDNDRHGLVCDGLITQVSQEFHQDLKYLDVSTTYKFVVELTKYMKGRGCEDFINKQKLREFCGVREYPLS